MPHTQNSESHEASVVHPDAAALRRAMQSLRGYATWSPLDTIFNQAVKAEGFTGTLAEAVELLRTLPGVQIELADDIGESRIHSDFWVPR